MRVEIANSMTAKARNTGHQGEIVANPADTSETPSGDSPVSLLAVVRETESLRARSARWSAPSLTRVAMARSRLVLSTADPRGRWRGPVVDGPALHDPREGSGVVSSSAGA